MLVRINLAAHLLVYPILLLLLCFVPAQVAAQGGHIVKQWGLPGDIPVKGDFDGDGRQDHSIWRPSDGYWLITLSSNNQIVSQQWGLPGDIPVAEDYDADGLSDYAVWRPSNGTWYILSSSTLTATTIQWGLASDIPVVGDYDGDGIADAAVWRPSDGRWHLRRSTWGNLVTGKWGEPDSIPVQGDYDGDQVTDIAYWDSNTGVWFVYRSSGGSFALAWGLPGDSPVTADFNGDGLYDFAVTRVGEKKEWYVQLSGSGDTFMKQWVDVTDFEIPGDFDGDGRDDIAVWVPTSGYWFTTTYSETVCDILALYDGTNTSVSGMLQACINNSFDTVETPPGSYFIEDQIRIVGHARTLRTFGKEKSDPPCGGLNGIIGCTELKATSTFDSVNGLLHILADGTDIHHLVINGRYPKRVSSFAGSRCLAGDHVYGTNIYMQCSSCSITKSVSMGGLCGSALEVACIDHIQNNDCVAGERNNVNVSDNYIYRNGTHDTFGLWSDGITVHNVTDSTFKNNHLRDNTDVQLIFFRCVNCDISDNIMSHSRVRAHRSFAAMMLTIGVEMPGEYTGTTVTNNLIDCYPGLYHCGFGLYIGSDAWFTLNGNSLSGFIFGGSVHHNTIRNAEQGFNVDDANSFEIYDNYSSGSAGTSYTSCGVIPSSDYNIGLESFNLDLSNETLGTVYTNQDWNECTPAWYQ